MENFTRILCFLLAVVAVVRSCEKFTFVDTMVAASTSPDATKADMIPVTLVTGCLEPGRGLEEARRIAIVNESVPVLYEEAVKDLTYLEVLNLDFDGIKDITPGAFQNLPSLRVLTLVGNKLKLVREGVFNGLTVRYLRLSNNTISIIEPGAFNDMPNLEMFQADFNKISLWNPSWFTSSPNIVRLSFSHNKIVNLPPYAFKNVGGDNPSIYLSNNKISMIDSLAFQGLDRIGYLDLRKNSIMTLPPNMFSTASKITALLLDGNKITCLSEAFLNALPPVDYYVSVNDNPWDCMCLKTVTSWSTKHTNVVDAHLSELECSENKIKQVLEFVKSIKDMKAQFATMKYGPFWTTTDSTPSWDATN